MKNYRVLSWVFLALAIIGLASTLYFLFFMPSDPTLVLKPPPDPSPFIESLIIDIILWILFFYFRSKSRK